MSQWSETANADNALATATKAANPRQSNRLRGVVASYEVSTDSGLLQVKLGAVVILEVMIHGGGPGPIPIDRLSDNNETISAELAASGTATNLGYVNIWGDDNHASFPTP